MQIIKNQESFDLPTDCSIEIENTSPLFSNKGSSSTPQTFPPSPKNQKLLGFPGRPDRANKINQDDRVLVLSGAIARYGVLNVMNGNIEANIGFDESEAYAKMSKTKLPDLENLPVFTAGGNDPLTSIINHLTSVMQGATETDYCIFPAISSLEEDTNTGNITYSLILNEIGSINNTIRLLGSQQRNMRIKMGNEYVNIDMPAGYAISPFLKLHKLLDIIWNNLGFRLTENPFATHHQLKKAVILNNTFDTIVTGKINYAHLMPDCTIEDVMSFIWAKFGARCFVDSNTKTVRIKLIRDILQSTDVTDYSKKKSGHPVYTITSGKQLKFTAGRSITKAAVDIESFDAFLKKVNYSVNPVKHSDLKNFNSKIEIYIIDNLTGFYYYNNPGTHKLSLISSSLFDFDKQEKDIESEEIKSPDEQLPILADVAGPSPAPFMDSGEYHINTSLRLNKPTDEKNDNEKRCPLCVCFAIGEVKNHPGYFFGSIFGKDSTGEARYIANGQTFDIDLIYNGEYGLIKHFFQEYIDFLHHANQQVEQEFTLSALEQSTFDFSKKIIVDGQTFLPESFNQIMGKSAKNQVPLKMRSLRLQKPYDLEKEHEISKSSPVYYYWKNFTNERDMIDARRNELFPPGTQGYHSCEFWEYETKPSATEYLFLQPPTEEEYNNKKTHSKKYILIVDIEWEDPTVPVMNRWQEPLEYEAGVIAEHV